MSAPQPTALLARDCSKHRQFKGLRQVGESGYAAQAQQRSAEALALAQQIEHPPSLAYAQLFAAILAQYRRDTAATYARADALMAFTTAQGLALRAVLSLGRLWQRQGKRAAARQIYGWFPEGLNTPDLQAAKTFLDVL